MEGLCFHPWKRLVVVSCSLDRTRQDRSMSHHVFFHLKTEGRLGEYMREVRRGFEICLEACTHELISDQLSPLLIFSFGCDH